MQIFMKLIYPDTIIWYLLCDQCASQQWRPYEEPGNPCQGHHVAGGSLRGQWSRMNFLSSDKKFPVSDFRHSGIDSELSRTLFGLLSVLEASKSILSFALAAVGRSEVFPTTIRFWSS